MRCENCLDIEEQDGAPAPCHVTAGRTNGSAPAGCPIPPLSADEARILDMRGMLIQLKDLVDAGTVLRMYGATLEELRILAAIEEGLREKK